jgi:hypothetical protein
LISALLRNNGPFSYTTAFDVIGALTLGLAVVAFTLRRPSEEIAPRRKVMAEVGRREGERIREALREVQPIFRPIFNATDLNTDGGDFDCLFRGGERFETCPRSIDFAADGEMTGLNLVSGGDYAVELTTSQFDIGENNRRDLFLRLAVQLLEELPIELWSGARLMKRLALRENRKAITYEVHEGRMVLKEK